MEKVTLVFILRHKISFNDSFASIEKSKYWCKENTSSARDMKKNSNKKFYFNCEICKHKFLTRLSSITSQNQWCPYCANKKLCDDVKCEICFNKSFASNEKSKYWSKINKKSPRETFRNSRDKVFFDCVECGHQFIKKLNDITSQNQWCPYCGHRRLCDDINCKYCFNRSFASSEKAKYWSEKNIEVPRSISKNSAKKFIFKCESGHEFITQPSTITSMHSFCPFCKNKTELKLRTFLISIYPNTISEFKPSFCKNPETNYFLPYDFCIPDLKIIIELDGIQHMLKVMNWQNPEERIKKDIFKMKMANMNDYSVIRIFQEDVYQDKINWKELLLMNIEDLADSVKNSFISKNNSFSIIQDKLLKNNIIQ